MSASRRLKRLAVVLTVSGLLRCGGDGNPTAPSRIPVRTTSIPQQPASYTLTGQLTNIVTGEPVPGARLEIQSVSTAQTGSDGRFEITVGAGGELPLAVEAEGFWRRETSIRVTSPGDVRADLVPHGQGFDLDFFDHVFRDLGRLGTRRWTVEPEFEVWTRTFDCLKTDRGFCMEMVATEQEAPGQFVNLAHDVVTTDASKLTGGAISGFRVSMVSHPPGTVLRGSGDLLPEGKITLAVVQLPEEEGSWAWYRLTKSGKMKSGHVQISKRYHKLDRGVISHELAHVLGFDHPMGGDYVPLKSIIRYDFGSEPTRHDLLHGRILYRRPPGSRTPDIDPEGYPVNTQEALGGPQEESIEKLIRN